MAINIVETVFNATNQKTVTLTDEQIERSCMAVIQAMKKELPEETLSAEVFDHVLGMVKEIVRSMPVKLQ